VLSNRGVFGAIEHTLISRSFRFKVFDEFVLEVVRLRLCTLHV
jgi:hypothetical protein